MNRFILGLYFAILAVFHTMSANVIASEAITERKVLIDDRFGTKHQITQKIYEHGDGFYTFVRDGRPNNLIAIHKRICESVGGEDVFGKVTIMASEAAQDVAVCEITDPKVMVKIVKENPSTSGSSGRPAQRDAMIAIESKIQHWPPALTLIQSNRNVPVRGNYQLNEYVVYHTEEGGFYSNELQAEQCSAVHLGTVDGNKKGMFYLTVFCRSNKKGIWPVYFTSTIPGFMLRASGEIKAK